MRPTGLRRPTTTPVPDEIFDRYLAELSGGALKVLLYIVRRTLGFRKDRDAISFNQFHKGVRARDGRVLDRGCGLKSTSTINAALQELYDLGLINRRRGTDERGEHEITVYSLRFGDDDEGEDDQDPRASGGEARRGVLRKSKDGTSEISAAGAAEIEAPVLRKPKQHETVRQQTAHETVQQHERDPSDEGTPDEVVVALTDLGITDRTARELATRHPEDRIRAQIDMLTYRRAADPAAVLVKAIREGWAPPAGYEAPQRREARARAEGEERALREELEERRRREREGWRERMVVRHGIDAGTTELWAEVRRRLDRYLGAGACDRIFSRALLLPLPPGGRCARVLVESYARKQQVGEREREALEVALAGALGRRVGVELAWES